MALTIEWAEDGNIPSFTTQSHYNYILNLLATENPYPSATEYFTILTYAPSDVTSMVANHLAIVFPINSVSKVDLHTPPRTNMIWDCQNTDFTPNTNMNGRFWYVRQQYNEYFRKIDNTNSNRSEICRNYKETDNMVVYVINHTMPLTINGQSPKTESIQVGSKMPSQIILNNIEPTIYHESTLIWG